MKNRSERSAFSYSLVRPFSSVGGIPKKKKEIMKKPPPAGKGERQSQQCNSFTAKPIAHSHTHAHTHANATLPRNPFLFLFLTLSLTLSRA